MNEAPIMQEHLTKYRSLMPSLALIFHLIDVAAGPARKSALEQKLQSLIARGRLEIELAPLRKQLADLQGQESPSAVSLVDAQLAAKWCELLEAHARRIYGLVFDMPLNAAEVLTGKIQKGELTNGFTERDIYRKGWTNLTVRNDVKAALDELVAADWIKEVQTEGGWQQKASTTYVINPRIHEMDQAA